MQFSRIFAFASLLFFFAPKAIALTVDPSLKNLNTQINLTQSITPEEESIWKNAALGSLTIALAEVGDRGRMVDILRTLDNPDIRVQILSELGLRLVRKGDFEFAWNLIQAERDKRFLAEIFHNLMAEEQSDRAWEFVQLANEEDNRVLLLFVEAAIANQQYDRAWEILRDLDGDLLQSMSLRGLAFGFAEQGKSDRILEIVDIVDSDRTKQDFTLLAALSLVENGKPKQALDIVPRLERNINRVHALGAIGLKFIENGERNRGEEQFEILKTLLPQLEANAQTNSVLSNLSTYLARGGEFDLALELSDRITNSSVKAETLFYTARHLGEAGKFARALELISKIDVPGFRETAIQQIAIDLVKKGKSDRALSLLRPFTNSDETLKNIATILAEKEKFALALEVVEEIQGTELKTVTLGAIAFHLHQKQQLGSAQKNLDRALKLWDTLAESNVENSLYEQDSLLSLIVLPFVESEAYEIALEILQKIADITAKKNTVRDAAYTVAETGKREESLKFIALIEDKLEKIGALIFLTVQLDRLDKKEVAIAVLTDALELSETLQNPEQKALLLSSIATQFAELDEYQEASEIVDRVIKLLGI